MSGGVSSGELGTVTVSIGWQSSAMTGEQDLDLAVFGLGAQGTVVGDGHFVFFNNTESPDGAVRLVNVDEAPDGMVRERATVDLSQVAGAVQRILFVVSSYNGLVPFSAVTGAFIAVESSVLGSIANYDLTRVEEGFAFAWGALYRDEGRWLLGATGVSFPTLQEVADAYHV